MIFFHFRKLLKEHESKYEPLGHDESFNIMEEILAMQIGLNADQVKSFTINRFQKFKKRFDEFKDMLIPSFV